MILQLNPSHIVDYDIDDDDEQDLAGLFDFLKPKEGGTKIGNFFRSNSGQLIQAASGAIRPLPSKTTAQAKDTIYTIPQATEKPKDNTMVYVAVGVGVAAVAAIAFFATRQNSLSGDETIRPIKLDGAHEL